MDTNFANNFQWLLGAWKIADGRAIYEEWWQQDEHSLEGFRYALNNGKKRALERYYLKHRENDIYLSILVAGSARPVYLRMNFVTEKMAVFENPLKTFPTFIQYKLTPKNVLHVTSDGPRKDNKSQRILYPFTKME